MTKQSQVLRLADRIEMEADWVNEMVCAPARIAAAHELRRLHAENQRMASELARPMTSEATLVLHDNTRLRKINKQLLEALEEAAGDIESWGAYAAEYFQKKHNLLGAVRKARAAIAAAKETQ